MKKFAIVVVVAAVVLIGGAILTIDTLARSAIETGAEAGLGVPADVGSVSLRFLLGSFRMNDLEIANPEGYGADHFLKLGKTETSVSYRDLREGDVVLERLVLSDLDVFLEWKGRKANYSEILDASDSGGAPEEPSDTRFIIDDLLIQNVHATLSFDTPLGKVEAREVHIPELRFKGIGRKKGGIGVGAVTHQVVTAVLSAVLREGKGLAPELALRIGSGIGSKLSSVASGTEAAAEKLLDKTLDKTGGAAEKLLQGIGNPFKRDEGK